MVLFLSYIKVDFVVIFCLVFFLKLLVVVNIILEYIIWDRVNFISKYFNKIVFVNNFYLLLDICCNDVNLM